MLEVAFLLPPKRLGLLHSRKHLGGRVESEVMVVLAAMQLHSMVVVPAMQKDAEERVAIGMGAGVVVVCLIQGEACEECSNDCRAWKPGLDASPEAAVAAVLVDPSCDPAGLVVVVAGQALHTSLRCTWKPGQVVVGLGMLDKVYRALAGFVPNIDKQRSEL